MNLSKIKKSPLLTDRFAAKIAHLIMSVQIRTSQWLNQRFNAYSTRSKKRIVILVGLLISTFLIAGSFSPFYTIAKLPKNYSSAHIGLPSDQPKTQFTKRQLTDSLTKKK